MATENDKHPLIIFHEYKKKKPLNLQRFHLSVSN